MDIGWAISKMRDGKKVQRAGWNGKGMWLVYVHGSLGIPPVEGTPYRNAGLVEPVNIRPRIDMYTAQGEMQPGWLASQADLLADDWQLAE